MNKYNFQFLSFFSKNKFNIIILLIILLLPQTTHAITNGSAIGMGLNGEFTKVSENQVLGKSDKDNNLGLGVFYKYNWNIVKFIFGIETYYNYLQNKTFINNSEFEFKYNYGVNLNIGYDILKKTSIYGIIGFGVIKYKLLIDEQNIYDKKESDKIKGVIGFGIGHDFSVSWKGSLEYTYQELDRKWGNYKFRGDLNLLKLSIIYKF